MDINTACKILKAAGFNVHVFNAAKGQFCCQSFGKGGRVYASCYQSLEQGCLILNDDHYQELPSGPDIVERIVLEALRHNAEKAEACAEALSV